MRIVFKEINDLDINIPYTFSIFNLFIFFIFSIVNIFLELHFNFQIIFLSIFILGSFMSFILFFFSRKFMSPIVWFTLGSFVFIGLGSLASLLEIHNFFKQNIVYLLVDIKYSYILNSSALLIINLICYLNSKNNKVGKYNLKECILTFMGDKVLFGLLFIIVTFLFIRIFNFFPASDNYILNSIIHKFSFLEPGLIVLFMVRFAKVNSTFKLLIIFFFLLEIFIASLLFSKFKILIIILSLCLGIIINKKNIFNLIGSGLIFLLILFFIKACLQA